MKILLVEDNITIVKGLEYAFKKNNYDYVTFTSIADTKDYLERNNDIALAILDITLPDGNGVVLYQDIVKKISIPTIFLTAKDEEDEIVSCLNMGAEDYITKPFSTKELVARINKILMRYHKSTIIKVQDISMDMDKMIVKKNNEIIELTALELKLLNLLFLNINKVVTRHTILDKIWEWTGNDVDDHTITVYFKRIKDKLKTDIIITIKGIGYRIDEK